MKEGKNWAQLRQAATKCGIKLEQGRGIVLRSTSLKGTDSDITSDERVDACDVSGAFDSDPIAATAVNGR